jgi:tight adherence protein B
MIGMTGQPVLLGLAVFGLFLALSYRGSPYRLHELHASSPSERWARSTMAVRISILLVCLASVVAGAGMLMLGVGATVVIGMLAASRLLSDRTARRVRRGRQLAVIGVCDALAAELTAGLSATRAVERAFGAYSEWASVVAAVRVGGDVVATLRHAAASPGAEGLRAVAAGWEIAGRSGSALATVLDRIAAGLRSDDEARCEVTASLGPPRATARMLAFLPLFGLMLGSSMGAQPVAFLFTTPMGLVCLSGGVGLALAGVFWVERLASAAEV